MRVVVTYNDDAHLKKHLNEIERIGEEEVVATAREVAELTRGRLLPVRDVRAALDELRREKPDVVFNFCEGVAGRPRWEMHFALALEMLGIPFTGCDPTAVGICNDKLLTKNILQTAGIEVPATYSGAPAPSPAGRGRSTSPTIKRWIVKPRFEDAGIGIDADSVCTTEEEVRARCEHVAKTYGQPAVVEEFIDGREVNQAMFFGPKGAVLLPPGEIVFDAELQTNERLVGWKAKWAGGSREDRATVSQPLAAEDDTLQRDLADLCSRAAAVLSVGGYCRFDVRQRATGELCILDVNPNPDIGAGSGFRKALSAAGIAFGDFVTELMMAAQSRRRP